MLSKIFSGYLILMSLSKVSANLCANSCGSLAYAQEPYNAMGSLLSNSPNCMSQQFSPYSPLNTVPQNVYPDPSTVQCPYNSNTQGFGQQPGSPAGYPIQKMIGAPDGKITQIAPTDECEIATSISCKPGSGLPNNQNGVPMVPSVPYGSVGPSSPYQQVPSTNGGQPCACNTGMPGTVPGGMPYNLVPTQGSPYAPSVTPGNSCDCSQMTGVPSGSVTPIYSQTPSYMTPQQGATSACTQNSANYGGDCSQMTGMPSGSTIPSYPQQGISSTTPTFCSRNSAINNGINNAVNAITANALGYDCAKAGGNSIKVPTALIGNVELPLADSVRFLSSSCGGTTGCAN